MISTNKTTTILCSLDDFFLVFEPAFKKNQLLKGNQGLETGNFKIVYYNRFTELMHLIFWL